LEQPEERGRAGKPSSGTVTLSTVVEGHEFVIRVRDDGKGIDWDRLRDRAAALGLPVKTRADLERALFADGVSTADEVTGLSGRGVGMGAVQAACVDRGGTLVVDSIPGGGTTLEFRFPVAEMAPSPAELAGAAA
jgi:two-component system chemotaxis sensor kinase CheA